jgi:hypothetical protein
MSQRFTLTCGLGLLIFGVLLLLTTLGVFQIDFWGFLVPAAMIGLGILTLWLVATRRNEPTRSEVHAALDGAASAVVHLRFGAGRLTLAGGAGPDEVGAVDAFGGVEQKVSTTGTRRSVEWKVPTEFIGEVLAPWKWAGREPPAWSVRLRQGIPIDLRVEAGACDMDLDLTSLQIGELRLLTGASGVQLRMPAAGETRAHVSAGAAGVRVIIPEGVAARIRVPTNLGEVSVDPGRFPGSGGQFESRDYAAAANKLDLTVEVGAASVNIS